MTNKFFKTLLILSGLITLYMGINFFVDLHCYFDLSKKSSTSFESWKVEEIKPGKYILAVSYQFIVNEVTYRNHFQFNKPIYPNIYLANDHLEKWQSEKNIIWYAPKNPQHSSFIRQFPIKKGIHLILSVGVFLYFLWLSFYIRATTQSTS